MFGLNPGLFTEGDARGEVLHIAFGEAEKAIAIERGGQVELSCTSNQVGRKIEWIREDGQPLPRTADIKNGNLLIASVDISSGGRYVCRLQGGSSVRSVVHVVPHLGMCKLVSARVYIPKEAAVIIAGVGPKI